MSTGKKIIVAFKIGRGGIFNNAGNVSYIGEKNLQDLISLNDHDCFILDRDNKGRFCKAQLCDGNGNVLLTTEEFSKEIGTLDFDGQYDTVTCCYIEECDENDLEMIRNSDEYKSIELDEYLKNN